MEELLMTIKDPIIIFVTTSSMDEAKTIGKELVKEKFAACTNIIPNMQSLFVWKEEFCDEEEILLIIKSNKGLLNNVIQLVEKLHSYDVPEIIAIPIIGGSEKYLKWLHSSILNIDK
jgi:periplasmic divalent cation tolerance protein